MDIDLQNAFAIVNRRTTLIPSIKYLPVPAPFLAAIYNVTCNIRTIDWFQLLLQQSCNIIYIQLKLEFKIFLLSSNGHHNC